MKSGGAHLGALNLRAVFWCSCQQWKLPRADGLLVGATEILDLDECSHSYPTYAHHHPCGAIYQKRQHLP